MAKQWGIERYKEFLISSSATPTFATGFDWYSQGIILRPARLGSIIEVKRVEGPIFNSKEAAEEPGLINGLEGHLPQVVWPTSES